MLKFQPGVNRPMQAVSRGSGKIGISNLDYGVTKADIGVSTNFHSLNLMWRVSLTCFITTF